MPLSYRKTNNIIFDYNKKSSSTNYFLVGGYDNIKKEYNQYQLKSKYFYHEKELKINDEKLSEIPGTTHEELQKKFEYYNKLKQDLNNDKKENLKNDNIENKNER